MKVFIESLVRALVIVILLAIFTKLYPDPTTYHYFSLLFLILLFYYLIIPLFKSAFLKLSKKFTAIYPSIGVLNGNIESPTREYKCNRAWTEVTSSMWVEGLIKVLDAKKLKRIKLITTSEITNKFKIIVNPFGDIYPEENKKLHITFYKICDYIRNGGIFVCTGGSFCAHQNTKESDIHEWVFTKIVNGAQSLKDSFLYLEFGIQTTGDFFVNDQHKLKEPTEVEVYQKDIDKSLCGNIINDNIKIKRFRALTPSTSDFIPLIREKSEESFPVALVRYGDGYLLHAGMHLTSNESIEFSILLQVINFMIQNNFSNF